VKDTSPPTDKDTENSASTPTQFRRRRWIFTFLALCLALCLAIFLINDWRPWEPRHEGRAMSSWLKQLNSTNGSVSFEAHLALIAIGPPAVPPLIEQFEHEETKFEKKYTDLHARSPTWLGNILPQPFSGLPARREAAETLRAMGPSPATPRLPCRS
jgi:hypothetical protein